MKLSGQTLKEEQIYFVHQFLNICSIILFEFFVTNWNANANKDCYAIQQCIKSSTK